MGRFVFLMAIVVSVGCAESEGEESSNTVYPVSEAYGDSADFYDQLVQHYNTCSEIFKICSLDPPVCNTPESLEKYVREFAPKLSCN